MNNVLNVAAVTLAAILTIDPAAFAAEIKIMSTHAVQEVLEEICPQFERATGHKVIYSYDPTTALKNQILQGAVFDVVFLSRAALDELKGHRIHRSPAGRYPEGHDFFGGSSRSCSVASCRQGPGQIPDRTGSRISDTTLRAGAG